MVYDEFSSHASTPGGPAMRLFDIVPNDGADLAEMTSALNVETPGTVRVTTKGGSTTTVFIAAGVVFPLRTTKVWATGTTATGLRGLV